MNPDHEKFLRLERWPARLTVEQTAWVLGVQPHDIPILVRKGLLRPLGHPSQSSTKYFASCEQEELRKDVRWLTRATDAIYDHWRHKNSGDDGETANEAA